MAEKLKPIEGYTITAFPYGKIWHVCDTCGMAVAAEEISSHVKFDHDPTDSKLLKPMPGWTITRHANTAVVHMRRHEGVHASRKRVARCRDS